MSDQQAASGKKKKGGKKGKKGGGSPTKGQKNKGKKTKSLDEPRDDTPPSLLEFHLHNKPVPDSPNSRDEDIARFQNEAAVLEKNIREITTKIEKDVRERQAFKGKRQEAYEAMNAARDILQARKADKDKVYQRIQQYRNSRNSLRGDRGKGKGKGRNFRTIRELDQAIAQLERDMQTEVLTLQQEKAKMREMKELSKMRPDVQKISRQNEVLQQFTESTKDQQDEDQAAYKTLKASVQAAYTVQQGKYELFQVAVTADEELNMAIDASIENRKASYARQKDIRQLISTRKRDYQKSQRDVQRWDQQTRKLKREVDFYNRRIQKAERDRKRDEQQAAQREWKAQAARDKETADAQQAEQPKDAPQRQRNNRRPERDDTAAKPDNDGPRPPRTTRPPRERQQRKPRVQKVYSAPVTKDALETQKFQLNSIITYVKTLLPRTGESTATTSLFTNKPGNSVFNSHKGGFKPSRDADMFGQDLFSNNRKSKKSKRKKKNKAKNVFFVQSHTPPTVMDAFKSLRRWLGNSGYTATIALPMKPGEAEGCIKSLSEVEKFLADGAPRPADTEPERSEPDAAEPTEEAPEQSEAQPEAAEPEQKDEQPTEEPAEESAAQPESLPSAPAPDAEPQPSDTQEADAGADATEVSADTATDADADALSNTQQPEAANAQPEDDATEKDAAAVDLKPEQPDTTVNKDNDDAAPAQATNENPDDEEDDSDDDDDEDESSDGVEVMESMVI